MSAEGVPAYLSRSRRTLEWTRGSRPREVQSVRLRPPDIVRAGDRLAGNYEIRRLLGSGGMGQVWEAHDHALNRTVAVKLAWPDIPKEPLRREAQVQAAFRHPGLVTAHALVHDGEREFLVMERVSGVLLSERISQSRRFALDEALEILLPICETLEVLHANGLAHCDLKPTNIMLSPGGRVVLLDFGIARIEQAIVPGGTISGSPHFMAPEVIRGHVLRGEAHKVDLYALGVIAFLLFTGRLPFDNEDSVEILIQQLETPPPRLAAERPDLSREICNVVDQMLAKSPGERPERIEIIAEKLRPSARHGRGGRRRSC